MVASKFIGLMLVLMRNLGLESIAIHPDSGKIAPSSLVMAGLVPAIHVFFRGCREDVDARHKATAVRFSFGIG